MMRTHDSLMKSRSGSFDLNAFCCLTALAVAGVLGSAQQAEAIYINKPAADARGFYNIWDEADAYRGVVAINLDGGQWCTGTLIDSRTVVTAAHCVEGAGPAGTSRFFISFGNDRNIPTPHDGTVSGVLVHPQRTGEFGAYDLTLLSLERPVTEIAPIVLADRNSPQPSFGEILEIAGYGAIGEPGDEMPSDARRRFAEMNFGALATSDNPHPLIFTEFRDPESPNFPDFFKLGANGVPVPFLQGSAAPGDSGGPIFIRRDGALIQIGTVVGGSYFGDTVGDPSIPDYGIINIYTPVALFDQWLQQNMAYRSVTAKAGDWKWSDAQAWTDRLGRAGSPDNKAGSFLGHGSLGRYYGVNLTNAGHISLDMNPTIDDLTIANADASLDIGSDVALDVIGTSRLIAGALHVDGGLRSSSLSLLGGLLSGSGEIETHFGLINHHGIIAPGSAGTPGTLDVTGAYVQGAQGVLWSRLSGAQAGQLAISGTAELDGGLLLSRGAGTIDLNHDYGVLSADDGVSGAFSQIATTFAFLEPHLNYGPNAVSVRLQRNSTAFSSVAATGNQRSVGESLASLGSGPILDGLLNATKEEARLAFSQLSGEAYASNLSAQIGQAVILPNILFGRMAAASGTMARAAGESGAPAAHYASLGQSADVGRMTAGGAGIRNWAMLYGSKGQASGDANVGSVNSTTGGIFTGLEHVGEDNALLGMAFGYGTSQVALPMSGGRTSSEDFRLAVYGAAPIGDLTLTGGAALGWHNNTMKRPITLPGFSAIDSSDNQSRSWQVFGEAAYGFNWDALRVGLETRHDRARRRVSSMTEAA